MNHLYAAGLLLLFVSFAVADHHHTFSFCGNKTKCESAGLVNVTCVTDSATDCAKLVAEGKADLTLASANSIVEYEDKLKIVLGQKLNGLEKFVQYYGLAVVEKNSTIKLTELKGVKSCHTGVDKTVGWKIPVGYLLYTKEMKYTKDEYTSASAFFGDSCAAGIKNKSVSDEVKDDFCKLCKGTCGSDDGYSGYVGAFKCMADGDNDRVGFVKQTTANDVFTNNPGKYGSKADYKLLCQDGKTKDLDSYATCNIDKRPLYALVTSKNTTNEMVTKMQNVLNGATLADLVKGGMVSSGIEKLEPFTGSAEAYVGDYGKHYKALNGPNTPAPGPNSAPTGLVSCILQAIAIFAFLMLV